MVLRVDALASDESEKPERKDPDQRRHGSIEPRTNQGRTHDAYRIKEKAEFPTAQDHQGPLTDQFVLHAVPRIVDNEQVVDDKPDARRRDPIGLPLSSDSDDKDVVSAANRNEPKKQYDENVPQANVGQGERSSGVPEGKNHAQGPDPKELTACPGDFHENYARNKSQNQN